MRKTVRPLALLLGGLLLTLVASLSVSLFGASPGAQSTVTKARELRRSGWDYSVVTVDKIYADDTEKTTCVISICYLSSSGDQCEKVKTTVDGSLDRSAEAARTQALARVIGNLGDGGWEMLAGEGLGLGKEGEIKCLYFRRAKH